MTEQQRVQLDAILREGPLDLLADVGTLRAAFEERMKRAPVADDVALTETTIGGVDVVDVTIADAHPPSVVLYFHGGVYVIGSAAASVPLVAELARRADARAITVDYRLAPEHPFPAAVEDALAVYEGLIGQGIDPAHIALAGESAGGGLAIAALLGVRDAGLPLPRCALLMSPYVDLTLSGETLASKQAVDPVLTPDGLRIRVPQYVDGDDAADPRISPIFGDLSGLPPLLIQVGSHEILLSDALRLAARAATADVQVTLEVIPGVPHVFQGFAAMLDEADAALDRAAVFVRERSGPSA